MAFSFKTLLGKSKGKKKFSFVSFDSYKDWKKIVLLFVIVSLVGAIWSGYIFSTVQNGTAYIQPVPDVAPTPLPSTNDLTLIRAQAAVKATEFATWSATTSFPKIVDPSL